MCRNVVKAEGVYDGSSGKTQHLGNVFNTMLGNILFKSLLENVMYQH